MSLELSNPTKSGLTLDGKTISVAYINYSGEDSVFLANTAEGFMGVLETEYYGGDEALSLFKVDEVAGIDSKSKEGMIDLVLETNSDLVFLIDVNKSETDSVSNSTPAQLVIYAYDSLNQVDTVRSYSGKVTLGKWDEDLYGNYVGKRSADIFLPSWTKETVYFYGFPYAKWDEALDLLEEYDFGGAMKLWMDLATAKNEYKCACARFNMASALYILGQNSLALKWLDRCDAVYEIPESASLRKKINSRLQ